MTSSSIDTDQANGDASLSKQSKPQQCSVETTAAASMVISESPPSDPSCELVPHAACSNRSEDEFDIEHLLRLLSDFVSQPEQLTLSTYLAAYEELHKFIGFLGTVFGFVAADVQAKIDLLAGYTRDEQTGAHYASLQSMIAYEREHKLLRDKKRPSGCRTFLRLHRALEFVQQFVQGLAELSGDERLDASAREAYRGTLYAHHGWLVQCGVFAALYMLPTRKVLLRRVLGDVKFNQLEADGKISVLLRQMGDHCRQAFEHSQSVMILEQVDDLP